ncbi:5-methyltetrahydropteroyltriglutamate--homocysteine S-methyltransferase [Microbacterium sp. MPKO10]|uniref:5-methyltetrahydropteroyltriglutamate-- homocysteine S-methyltransferase n=1 Tax=Microbacterium sp. MPKO10 TaxID=2989818 RepID=UPI0022357F82|nr:5-methyltetrahydropteroyltriglutamate--homocysteine S-methyltransferase [Microbacterium sp. MPKO10]MCW4456656.1 5-methyltetrahydropteroyltriglutamate--homocysteine S-methyltransferase [Microbacterium sp. MPKO10]
MRAHGFPAATILGYPRIGPRRELAAAHESYTEGRISLATLQADADEIRSGTRERLAQLGLSARNSSIPDPLPLTDGVLDTAIAVGALPERFQSIVGPEDNPWEVADRLTRGDGAVRPLESASWFGSLIQHYVPEVGASTRFAANSVRLERDAHESRVAGYATRPVLVGPVTLLELSAPDRDVSAAADPFGLLGKLVPVYAELLSRVRAAGADWVQLDEPAIVGAGATPRVLAAATAAYTALGAVADRPGLFVSTSYAPIGDTLAVLAATPVEAIGADLVTGPLPRRIDNVTRARLAEKTIVAGVIDGQNVWRGDLERALASAAEARRLTRTVSVSTSASLIHVPHDVTLETELDPRVARWLAFADQKVEQVRIVAAGLEHGSASVASELRAASAALADREAAQGRTDLAVRERINSVNERDRHRVPRSERRTVQRAALDLPVLPTSTIGAFPQTDEIVSARARYRSGVDSAEKYVAAMKHAIGEVIALQDRLGFDVLVHGEAERADMVTFFTENLEGFENTQYGWVQTRGVQCARPAILWGDVSRVRPITVAWTRFATTLTAKPVKGILTGPATLMSLSFVRDDQPLAETADQIALVLRDEIADLEEAGLSIIQVDEPALRDLRPDDGSAANAWPVRAFRLATGGARPGTHLQAHVCTSNVDAIRAAVTQLDADVTSFEAARVISASVPRPWDALTGLDGADRGDLAPGVYDVRTAHIPSVAEIEERLLLILSEVDAEHLWVVPDCGLTERQLGEAEPALRHLVEATRAVRERLGAYDPSAAAAVP